MMQNLTTHHYTVIVLYNSAMYSPVPSPALYVTLSPETFPIGSRLRKLRVVREDHLRGGG